MKKQIISFILTLALCLTLIPVAASAVGGIAVEAHTVEFNMNGHGTTPAAITVTSGSAITEPETPTAAAVTFGGWFTEAECTNEWNFSDPVTRSMTLYAKWNENSSNRSGKSEKSETAAPVLESYLTCEKGSACLIEKFTDTENGAWYHDGVHYCLDHGLMVGTSETSFEPFGITTRAQLAAIIYNLEGKPEITTGSSFSDIVSGSWYEKPVAWAKANGIISGYGDGSFGSGAAVSREQFAVILYNYAKFKGVDVSVDENTNFLSFNDFWDTSEWAKPAMMWAIERGLIVGDGLDLDPQGNAVRAQAATIICKFCETVVK